MRFFRGRFVGVRPCFSYFKYSLFTLLFFAPALSAASLYCQITPQLQTERSYKVSCIAANLPAAQKIELRFLDQFAGSTQLSERVSGLRIKDIDDAKLLPEIYGGGVFRMKTRGDGGLAFEYEIKPARITGAAADPGKYTLLSSLSGNFGTVLLADILPEICGVNASNCQTSAARLKFILPAEWEVATTERESYGSYEAATPERAVFFLGKLRKKIVNIGGTNLEIALAGDWRLSDIQLALTTATLAQEQSKFMRATPRGNHLVTLMPFPIPLTGLRSAALTRGNSVVMMLNPDNDAPSTLKLYQRLLAHEMFHFYLPEAFQIRENFDWFWEGFARYIGLLTMNRLGWLSRQELWQEMQNEFDYYRINLLRDALSLINASPEKFADAASYNLIYHKGTLVAWLYDLEMRRQNEGRKNITDVVVELYKNYAHTNAPIGNREVLATLRNAGKFDSFIQKYIEGTTSVDLADVLKPMGLSAEINSSSTRITLSKQLSSAQKKILNSFAP